MTNGDVVCSHFSQSKIKRQYTNHKRKGLLSSEVVRKMFHHACCVYDRSSGVGRWVFSVVVWIPGQGQTLYDIFIFLGEKFRSTSRAIVPTERTSSTVGGNRRHQGDEGEGARHCTTVSLNQTCNTLPSLEERGAPATAQSRGTACSLNQRGCIAISKTCTAVSTLGMVCILL